MKLSPPSLPLLLLLLTLPLLSSSLPSIPSHDDGSPLSIASEYEEDVTWEDGRDPDEGRQRDVEGNEEDHDNGDGDHPSMDGLARELTNLVSRYARNVDDLEKAVNQWKDRYGGE